MHVSKCSFRLWFSHRHFGAELHFHMFCVTLILLQQISVGYNKYHINTDKCPHILLGRHCINTIRYSQHVSPLKVHLQGA